MTPQNYICVLCGGHFEGYGNNPEPLKKRGECCNACNMGKFIPARIKLFENHTVSGMGI